MNIGEIARRAGVSRSTVSYALSGKRPVSAATVRRINDVIAELGYRPNASARALAEGRTRTFGLVIPPASARLTDVQLGFVASVVEAAAVHDHDVLLSPGGGDHDRSFDRIVTGRRVDGVILMEILLEDPRVERLGQAGLPFVTIGHTEHPGATWWVDVDYAGLISRCVHHLADLGHRDVVLSTAPTSWSPRATAPPCGRPPGSVEAAGERGLTAHRRVLRRRPGRRPDVLRADPGRRPEVTAVVTINEAALPGVQRALARAGWTCRATSRSPA